MSLVERDFYASSPEVTAAENAVEDAWKGNQSFTSGITGGHETFGSWFSSGLTGATLAEGMSEETQKDLYIKRNAANFGMEKINDTLQAFANLGAVRNFTESEAETIRNLQQRKQLMEDDLAFVNDKFNGDLDAVIDVEGQSFNDRWGADSEDVDVMAFLESMKNNPEYAAGLLTGEILKDLPLSVLGYFGLTAKGAKGASIMTKIYNKLNKIQPKALRGIAKVATPVAVGAGAGAGYEATYSSLNEGKIKWNDVQTGGEFGAVFGALGSLGVLAKGAKKKIDSKKPEPEEELQAFEKPPSEITKQTLKDSEALRIQNEIFMELWNRDMNIIPEVREGIDFKIVNATKGSFKPSKLDQETGVKPDATVLDLNKRKVIWNKETLDAKHKKVLDILDGKTKPSKAEKEIIEGLSPVQIAYLRDRKLYDVFEYTRNKAKIKQSMDGQQVDEVAAINTAIGELDRIYRRRKVDEADNSAVEAEKAVDIEVQEGRLDKELRVDDFDERRRGFKDDPSPKIQDPNSKVMNFVEKYRVPLVAAGIGAAYGLSDDKDSAFYQAALTTGAVLAGPKLYKAAAKNTLSQNILELKTQGARNVEDFSKMAKIVEVRTQTLGDRINKTFNTPELAIQFLRDAEKPLEKSRFNPKSEQYKMLKEYKTWMAELAALGAEIGMFKGRNGRVNLVSNYIPHIIRGKKNKDGTVTPLTEAEMAKLSVELSKTLDGNVTVRGGLRNVHEIPRKLVDDTIETLKQKGYEVVDNPAQIMNIYAQSFGRSLMNRKLLDSFEMMELPYHETKSGTVMKPKALYKKEDFNSAVSRGEIEADDVINFTEFDHPSLKGYMVHENVKGVLNDHFDVARRGGAWDVAENVLNLNNSLKRIFVFSSLFHAQALALSALYSMPVTLMARGSFKNIDPKRLKIGSGEFNAAVEEAIKDGLQIINTKSIELVNPGRKIINDTFEKLGFFGKTANKAFEKIDWLTWEFMHDRFKLAAHLRHKEILMRKGINEVAAGKYAAEFANDAFGSLDWNNFATRLYDYARKNPSTLRSKVAMRAAQVLPMKNRKWMNLALFAPDWTISNLRIVGRTFWNAHKVGNAWLHRIHKGKFRPEDEEFLKVWNMYSMYSVRAGVITSSMWWLMTSLFSDKEPTWEGIEDFWIGKNSGKLDLGGGESMVISKQIAEPIHWVQHPMHTAMNKASIIPKTMAEMFYNKQWMSMKSGRVVGPQIIEEDGTSHVAKWLVGKAVPISVKPLIDNELSWGESFERAFTGFLGFPQYGAEDKSKSLRELRR